jgi:tetratricopeptide (TPR) repeat protein
MLEAVYDDFKGDADYLFVLGLIYMNNAQFSKAIESFLSATKLPTSVVDGVNSYSAFHNVGVILECLGDKTNAISYYEKAGDYAPARAGIERCKQV